MMTAQRPSRARLSRLWPSKISTNTPCQSWAADTLLSPAVNTTDSQTAGRPTSRIINRAEAQRIESMMEQVYLSKRKSVASPACLSPREDWSDHSPFSPVPPPDTAPPPPPPPIAELDGLSTMPSTLDYVELPSYPPPPPPPPPPPASRHAPISAIRRRAKTPVHSVGQLERAAGRKRQAAIGYKSSVDSLAEQYRMLVASNLSRNNTVTSRPTTRPRPVTPQDYDPSPPENSPVSHLGALRTLSQRRSQFSPSPVSDDGTVVAYDDDTGYFKSIPSTPPSPAAEFEHTRADEDNATAPDTLRFQIGLELLRGELSSALTDQSSRAGRDAAALQIWVMIEAYEQLRDRIAKTDSPTKETREAAVIFDSWLGTLHSIQQSMAHEAALSDSEYDENDEYD